MLKTSFFIIIAILLVACSPHIDSQKPISHQKDVVSLGEVEDVLKEQGFELKHTKLQKNKILMNKLRGVTQKCYSLDGKPLIIYVFPTEAKRGKGIKSLEESITETEMKNYKAYGIENVLVFYVGSDEAVNATLFDALKSLER
jgi:hypothetical protein